MPFFRMFKRELFPRGGGASGDASALSVAEPATPYGTAEEDDISRIVDLTQRVFLVVERELRLTGFWESIAARNKLKAEIQKTGDSRQSWFPSTGNTQDRAKT